MITYPDSNHKELIKAFDKLDSKKEISAFLRDLLTTKEIDEFSGRFQIAKRLWTTTDSYKTIADEVGTSTTTVTRVAHWLYKENWHGYTTALEKMFGLSAR